MPQKTTLEPAKMKSTGQLLERTAEAMAMSNDPEKRAAAAMWLKFIRRKLAAQSKVA